MSGAALVYTPEIVTRLLEAAGETEMAYRDRIGPAAIRSCMPDTLRDADDYRDPRRSAEMAGRPRWDPPTPAQIAHMDYVKFHLMPILGGDSWHHWQRRRLVGLRSLIWPHSDRADPHVWSWRRLGDSREPKAPMPGSGHEVVQASHYRAVSIIAARLTELERRRQEYRDKRFAGALPPLCEATARLIERYTRSAQGAGNAAYETTFPYRR